MTVNKNSQDVDRAHAIECFLRKEQLPAGYREDIDRYFNRVAAWLTERCAVCSPFLLGISGAQGSGKTTFARYLQYALAQREVRAVVVSLDDFYLSKSARMALASTVHPLLATRGVPGTHDVDELRGCLETLRRLRQGETARWPVFDKSSDDRASQSHEFVGPAHAILFEGWCVGTPAELPDRLAEPLNELEASEDADGRWRRYVNARLAGDYAEMFSQLDGLCYLQIPNFGAVRRWRGEQERKLRARHGGGLADHELDRFLQHFERLTRTAARVLPDAADCLLGFAENHRCVRCVIRLAHEKDPNPDN